jgi:hypothetical protein
MIFNNGMFYTLSGVVVVSRYPNLLTHCDFKNAGPFFIHNLQSHSGKQVSWSVCTTGSTKGIFCKDVLHIGLYEFNSGLTASSNLIHSTFSNTQSCLDVITRFLTLTLPNNPHVTELNPICN